MPNKINPELEKWLWEVEYGLEDERRAFIRIGKALSMLRGPKYQKIGHMWRQDNYPVHITTFDQYCNWKWKISRVRLTQYMQAYEVYADIQEDVTNVTSSQPQSEAVMRPLTRLKDKEDRQRAWELASKDLEPGKKLTAGRVAEAVEIVKATNTGVTVGSIAEAKDRNVVAKAKDELREFSNEGISTKDAYIKIDKSWRKLIEDENEKAVLKLATLYKEYLMTKYPNS